MFLMIDQLLELYMAICKFLADYSEIQEGLSEAHLCVLLDVQWFLFYLHCMQKILSTEKNPTLSLILPL
uniref:Uncharacterized protein n=1 Tax=Moniliophthora roreri TaxID=221103 RepID=A0A0W0G706_MONRR